MAASGKDIIITIIDGLSKRVQWVAITEVELMAKHFAELFVEH
jgi:hypothetical protein